MPSPKNRLKLTGDTHPPDVEFDLGGDDDALEPAAEGAEDSRVYADGWTPPAQDQPAADAAPAAGAAAPRLQRPTPWMAIGAVLAVGFVVSRLLRR